jgi:hypothetical protein
MGVGYVCGPFVCASRKVLYHIRYDLASPLYASLGQGFCVSNACPPVSQQGDVCLASESTIAERVGAIGSVGLLFAAGNLATGGGDHSFDH